MLREHPTPTPAPDAVAVVLTCGDPTCQHTFEPDRIDFEAGPLACPECGGWTFQARLVEPTAVGGDRS
jgi:hypothetical protein